MQTLGRHLLIELNGCNPKILNDIKKVEEILVAGAKVAKATIIGTHFHQFSPFGISGVIVIAESHLAIHTWPEHGYAAVYQDCRGRHGSEGEDRVYADDAADGRDTLEWIAAQDWCSGRIGMSGSSAGATTTFAAASTRHPALRAFFAQAGGSSIYDDVVCGGQSIEMERLWLWVAKNIPGLSASHREAD